MFRGRCKKYFSALFLIFGLCLFSTYGFAKPVLIDGILAVVNGEIITLSDLMLREKRLYGAEGSYNDLTGDAIRELREKILQDLINEKLMINEAERMKLSPTEEEIKKNIYQIKTDNGFHSDEEFDSALARDGMNRKDFEKDISEEISLFRVHQRILNQSMQVTDREIREYYETEWPGNKEAAKVEISHILLKCPENNRPEKGKEIIKKANDIIKQWEQEKSFSKLASEFSEDVSAPEGGYLGWFYIKDLRPEFAEAIKGLQPGNITGPVITDLGYHIIFLSERKNIGLEQGSPIWEEIKEKLIERKRSDFFDSWIEKLRKIGTIEINKETLSRYQ
ncbi:MAG: peptidylprolyl isomerase [bacterium]